VTDLRDHHGMRGLIRHFITSNRGRPGYRRQFGMALLRANAGWCPKCRAADSRDARLRSMHAAYARRSR
jgi:hypothetical protein